MGLNLASSPFHSLSRSPQGLKPGDVGQILGTAGRPFVLHEMPQRKHVEGDTTHGTFSAHASSKATPSIVVKKSIRFGGRPIW